MYWSLNFTHISLFLDWGQDDQVRQWGGHWSHWCQGSVREIGSGRVFLSNSTLVGITPPSRTIVYLSCYYLTVTPNWMGNLIQCAENQPHVADYCRWGITRLRRMWHRGAISRTPILGNSWICRDSFDCLRRLLVLTTTSSRCGGEEGKKLGENWEFEAAMVNLARLSSTTGLVADHVRLPALDNYNICFCLFFGRLPFENCESCFLKL